jgi:aminoglycoside 6-adenylyltransferase
MDMADPAPTYELLIENILRWARGDENIRALVIIGSRARSGDHPADAFSDLDLFVAARDPKPLWETSEWLRQAGEPWISFLERAPDGSIERRVLFAGGLDVDFAPMAAEEMRQWTEGSLPPFIADLLRRGARILLDKDRLAEKAVSRAGKAVPEPPPQKAEFINAVHDFWYHAVWASKRLRRGEIWRAKSCCDTYLKNLLRTMLEWQARSERGEGVDTWMQGRFLEEWADPRALAALPRVFAHYDVEDIWRALQGTMDVFHSLADETAGRLGYSYPVLAEEKARGLVEEIRSGKFDTKGGG